MKHYVKPESCVMEALPWSLICESLTSSGNEDFTESEEISWNL